MSLGHVIAYVILILTFPPLAMAAFAGAVTGLAVAYGRMYLERRRPTATGT